MKTVDRWLTRVSFALLAIATVLYLYAALRPYPNLDQSITIDAAPATATVAAPVAATPPHFANERELVAYVNRTVNHLMVYQTDEEQYGVGDLWVSMPASGKGDCEDYAITKINILTNAGIDISSIRPSGLNVIVNGKFVGRHAVAIWTDPQGKQWLLDNGYDSLMPKDLMVKGFNGTRYRFLW